MTSNIFLNSCSSKLSNEKTAPNVVDLLVKCGTEIKNQSAAVLGKTLCTTRKFDLKSSSSSSVLSPPPPQSPQPQIPSQIPPTINLVKEESCSISCSSSSSMLQKPVCPVAAAASQFISSFQFIDPSELMRSLYAMSKRPFLILLDCRPYTEFNTKHIKDSVHLNCRDKLIKKRLQMQKITVKDLISCELTKSKLEKAASASLESSGESESSLDGCSSNSSSISSSSSSTSCSSRRSQFSFNKFATLNNEVADDSVVPDNNSSSNQSGEEGEAAENIIVIYDDTTSDEQDLLVDSNPLKIVQENIKKAGFQKECKILKGMKILFVIYYWKKNLNQFFRDENLT